MATPQPHHSSIDRPTQELILLALLEDEQKSNRRTQRQVSKHIGVAPSTLNGHLRAMANANPALVAKSRRGRWDLTDRGREEARGILRRQLLAAAQGSAPIVVRIGEIPLVGTIAAGEPILMEESRLLLDALIRGELPDWTSTALQPFAFPGVDPQHHFAMTVRGESMLHRHVCDGDIAIFRYATGIDGWANIRSGDIIAAAVPEGANIDNPVWLNQVLDEDFAGDTALNYITIKQYDALTKELVGRGGRIRTLFRPIGILEHLVRSFSFR